MSNLNVSVGLQPGLKRFPFNNRDPPVCFVMMRFNFKIALIFLVSASICTIVVLYSICNESVLNSQQSSHKLFREVDIQTPEEIDCDINGEYSIGCRKEGDEVYIPFSFLQKYYEVYGKLASYDGIEKFEWSHSYSRVYHPKSKYDPRGVFMYFENYNVEVRDRVKCICATEGVPISTQWESNGYYYPTQIAQFGLSHYSKNLTEPEPRRRILEDGSQYLANWLVPDTAKLQRVFIKESNTKVADFTTSENYDESISLKMDHVLDMVLSVNIMLNGNSSFSVDLQNRETNELYSLHYIINDVWITVQDANVYHGIGVVSKWKRMTRDLIVDLQKGLSYLSKDKSKPRIQKSKFKVVNIRLRGSGAIDNLTLSSSEHIQQFYDAAEWFVKYQDIDTGGWPIPVKRKISSGFQVLQPGWYSAMGQGHAISVLSRAYVHSGGDQRYLNAAVNGLRPFRISSSQGGVLATVFNKFHWYEEYPTKPASFVLNGFIYALLGLYDLMTLAPVEHAQEAEFLYSEGLDSLKHMITLFDMGSVTAYDLRHFTLGTAPNLARCRKDMINHSRQHLHRKPFSYSNSDIYPPTFQGKSQDENFYRFTGGPSQNTSYQRMIDKESLAANPAESEKFPRPRRHHLERDRIRPKTRIPYGQTSIADKNDLEERNRVLYKHIKPPVILVDIDDYNRTPENQKDPKNEWMEPKIRPTDSRTRSDQGITTKKNQNYNEKDELLQNEFTFDSGKDSFPKSNDSCKDRLYTWLKSSWAKAEECQKKYREINKEKSATRRSKIKTGLLKMLRSLVKAHISKTYL